MAQTHPKRVLHYNTVLFLHNCAIKLRMKPTTTATAAHIYHKFFSECSDEDYEPELIAATALYLAGKVEEQHIKLRDIVNVCHRALHLDEPPIDVGEQFWNVRDSVTQCELFVLRVLQFKVHFDHPHKYLLHYLLSIYQWMDNQTTAQVPIARIAWALIRDSYHCDMCLHFKPEHIAISVLHFTLQLYGLEVPYSRQARTPWWQTLDETIDMTIMRDITNQLSDMYNLQEEI